MPDLKISEAQRLRNKALRLLALREHSEKELLQKLSRAAPVARKAERNEGGASSAPEVDTFETPLDERTSQTHSPQGEPAVTTAELAARVLDELKDAGYQSNERTAQSLTRHFAGRLSKSAIANKLKNAGLSRDEIDDAFAQSLPDENTDDFATARKLWAQKFRAPPVDDREKAKHVRFLQTKGFSISVALKVLREAGSQADNSE